MHSGVFQGTAGFLHYFGGHRKVLTNFRPEGRRAPAASSTAVLLLGSSIMFLEVNTRNDAKNVFIAELTLSNTIY